MDFTAASMSMGRLETLVGDDEYQIWSRFKTNLDNLENRAVRLTLTVQQHVRSEPSRFQAAFALHYPGLTSLYTPRTLC